MALHADEEEVREDNISWSVVEGTERTVIRSHVPAWTKGAPRVPKGQGSSVCDSLYVDRNIISKFASLSFISKYDILAQLTPGVNNTVMGCTLKNVDKILMHCPVTNKTIPTHGKITRVQPPQAIVCHPHAYAPAAVVQCMTSFGPVSSHQPMPNAGQLLDISVTTDVSTHLCPQSWLYEPPFCVHVTFINRNQFKSSSRTDGGGTVGGRLENKELCVRPVVIYFCAGREAHRQGCTISAERQKHGRGVRSCASLS